MRAFNKLLLIASIILPSAFGINNVYASSHEIAENSYNNIVTKYLSPTRIMWLSDSSGRYISKPRNLLLPFSGQVSVADTAYTTMISTNKNKASILLDFGKEIHGGIEIASSIRENQSPAKIRICFGESVTEAMSSVKGKDGASNDHALRDFSICAPWLGTIQIGNSGFRFVRIDLDDIDVKYNLKAVRAISRYQDIQYLGSFESDNPRLNKIWKTGAYTVHLNMQEYLWDGIKRDRLVWIGDLHPEVMTVLSAFGKNNVVNRSLDFAKNDTPLPGWMNGMCSYSLWWIIIQNDLYTYQGDLAYLKAQHSYLKGLLAQICAKVDKDGNETLDGTRFLDWPTSENKAVINSGLHSLCYMAVNAGMELGKVLNDNAIIAMCSETAKNLKKKEISNCGNKEASALKIISGLSKNSKDCDVILKDGAKNFSTFYGYYMLEALAQNKKFDEATDIISKYWGAMLDLGATSFWEELNYDNIANAAPIDGFVPKGKFDIHADGGDYCYKGLRMSLCHGWASGVTPWMTKYILGIVPTDPGCSSITIEPHLSGCNSVKGTFPTPKGILYVSHKKDSKGKILSNITAPEGIKIILKNATLENLSYTK